MTPPLNRVLFADDAPDIRLVARLALEKVGGFAVRLCASGEEAVAAAAEFGPDIILLDVMMPGWDGPRTLAELRDRPGLAAIPVAFFTGRTEQAEVDRFTALGAIGVLPKPFDAMKLASDLRALWARHHG